jgi:integrase
MREAMAEAKKGYVFPAGKRSKGRAPHIHIESCGRACRRISERLGHAHWSAHDLRRSFITALHEAGTDPFLVRRLAGHRAGDVHSRHYDRAQRIEQMRTALGQWGEHIMEQARLRAADGRAEVLPLKRHG